MKLLNLIRTQKERILWVAFVLFMGAILAIFYSCGLIKE